MYVVQVLHRLNKANLTCNWSTLEGLTRGVVCLAYVAIVSDVSIDSFYLSISGKSWTKKLIKK